MPGNGATVLNKLLIGVSIGLAAIVAAALVVPSFVDWNDARGWIAMRLGEMAGHPVAIGGDVSFAMLPTPRLVAGGVTVTNHDGDADLVTARQIELRVLLLPLLLGRFEVEQLTLVEPILRLRRPTDSSPAAARRSSSALRLERVGIENGTILIDDRMFGLTVRLDDIDAMVTAERLGGPFQADGHVSAGMVPLTLDLRAGRAVGSGAMPVTLRLATLDGAHTARFAGLVDGPDRWQGDLSVRSVDPGALVAMALADGDRQPPGALSQPFSLRASIQAESSGVALNGLTATFGESRGTGSLSVALGDPLRADMTLAVNRMDVDGWPGGLLSPAELLAHAWPPPEHGFALPNRLAATADLSVEAIRYRGGLVRQLRLQAALDNGVFAVNRLSAQLPGGSDFGMLGTLRAEGGQPAVDLRAEAGSNDLRGVLTWLGIDLPSIPGAQLRRFAGTLALSGTADDFRLTGVDMTIDNSRLTGGLVYVNAGVPGIGLRFDIDGINLDAYRTTAGGTADWLDAAGEWISDRWPSILSRVNANVDGRVGQLTVDGTTASGLRLDATLTGGALTLREAAIESLAGISAHLSGSAERLAPPYRLDIAATAQVPLPNRLAGLLGFDVAGALDRLAPLDLGGRLRLGDESRLSLTAEMPEGSLELSGSFTGGGDDATVYDVAARLRHDSLEELFGIELFDAGPVEPSDRLDLYARLVGTPDAFTIETLQGMAGPVTLAADGRVSLRGDRPTIQADLRAGAIPLTMLLPVSWQRRPDGRWPTMPLEVSALDVFDGQLSLTAFSLTLGPYAIADPAAAVTLTDGVLEIEQLTGDLFGGRLGLSGRLEAGGPPVAALQFDLVGADAETLFAAAVATQALSGTANLGFEGESRGLSLAGLIRNLRGEGLIAIGDGRFEGLDLDGVAGGLAEPGSPVAFLETLRQALASGETPFAALNAPFVMADGVAATEDVRLFSDLGVGQGSATYDLLDNRLGAELGFSFHAHADAPPIRLLLDGRPEAPVFRYRAESLQDYVLERLLPATP